MNNIKDFYFEIKWEFESSVIPLVNKIAPSDTFKVWKYKDTLRLDYSIVGFKNLKAKRRNMTLIFNPIKIPTSKEFEKFCNSEKTLNLLWTLNKTNNFYSNPFVIFFFLSFIFHFQLKNKMIY